MNWRGRPLTSHEVIISLIGSTRTRTGLTVAAELDPGQYPKGIKVSDREIRDLEQSRRLRRHDWHPEWNYWPRRPGTAMTAVSPAISVLLIYRHLVSPGDAAPLPLAHGVSPAGGAVNQRPPACLQGHQIPEQPAVRGLGL